MHFGNQELNYVSLVLLKFHWNTTFILNDSLFLIYLINVIVLTGVMGVLMKLSFPEKGDTDHSMKKVKIYYL